ncbi:MAG: hypothetical protein KDK36_12225, partial [Leptospiraceae bacterium]|nr:hypothetical protein [Leptospiraceae bacterium]
MNSYKFKILLDGRTIFMKFNLDRNQIITICAVLLTALFFLRPLIFENLYPTGTDVIGSAGSTNLEQQIAEKVGER